MTYIKRNEIKHVIVFFKNAITLLGGKSFLASDNVITDAKNGIDQWLQHKTDNLFWQSNNYFKQIISDDVKYYLNMNTRTKNHGAHLSKRYFTYNLDIIFKDIIKNSPTIIKSRSAPVIRFIEG